MDGIQLSETEQRYFGDLFICCDADNSGKVAANKATELFRTANLPLDSLKQVTWKFAKIRRLLTSVLFLVFPDFGPERHRQRRQPIQSTPVLHRPQTNRGCPSWYVFER